ncbi:unnamed protein product, partial [Ectocarpus sp. 6 AP-2014]
WSCASPSVGAPFSKHRIPHPQPVSCLSRSMANVIQMGESKADVHSEVVVDSHEQQTRAAAAAVSATAADGDDVPGVPATLDAAEGTNGVAAGDETVVDEVIDAADDFGGSRVVGREGSENGHDDEPPSRRGRRGRSRSRSRSRSRDRAGGGMNRDSSRDRGRRRDGDRDREHDRSRGRDRDPIGRDNRERGRDDSRDRNRGSDAARDRDRGREHSRERDRGRGSSRDRDWGRDERDRTRGRDRDSFDNTRDRARQSGGQGQGRRDRGQTAPMDGGRAGGRDPFRGRGLSNNGPMMQPIGGNMPMMQPMGVPGAPMFPPQGGGHGQMVFTTTQRPQPKLPGPHTRTYNILPMISFKAFMAEQRDDVTPEECKQRYDEYKADYVQRLTHSFIDVHCKEEWFLERYHPKRAESTRYAKLKWVDKESAVFGEQLRANPRLFIASASLDPISEEQRWGGMDKRKKRPRNSSREDASVDAMEEDLDQPGETTPQQDDKEDGDADYDVNAKDISAHSDKVAFIRRIPAWVSTDELGRQIVEEAPQHERIVCSDAANTRNDDFARSAYIVYDTPEKATKAVQQLNKMRIYQNSKPKTKIAKKQSGDGRYFELKVFSYQPRSQNSVDHDFSTANRVAHDTKQSLKVAKALDEEFRRAESTDGITALLAEPEVQAALTSSSSGAAQLDLVCAYMKRVYFYVYYRGQECRDEGDMIASRGAGRGVPASSKEEVQEASDLSPSAMSKADAVEGTNGNGVAEASVGSTDKGETGQTSRRGSGTEFVDACSADRIKQAENAEETRKKDQAFVERYDERVKAEVTKWQAMNTGRTDEGYARCLMPNCGKA